MDTTTGYLMGIIGMGFALLFVTVGYLLGINDGKAIKVAYFRDSGGQIVTERGVIRLVEKDDNISK